MQAHDTGLTGEENEAAKGSSSPSERFFLGALLTRYHLLRPSQRFSRVVRCSREHLFAASLYPSAQFLGFLLMFVQLCPGFEHKETVLNVPRETQVISPWRHNIDFNKRTLNAEVHICTRSSMILSRSPSPSNRIANIAQRVSCGRSRKYGVHEDDDVEHTSRSPSERRNEGTLMTSR